MTKNFLTEFPTLQEFSKNFPTFPSISHEFPKIDFFFVFKHPGKIEGKAGKFPKNTQKIRNFPKKIIIFISKFSDHFPIFREYFSEFALFLNARRKIWRKPRGNLGGKCPTNNSLIQQSFLLFSGFPVVSCCCLRTDLLSPRDALISCSALISRVFGQSE